MEFKDFNIVERELVFPIYLGVYAYNRYDEVADYSPGRVLMGHYWGPQDEIRPDIVDHVTENDVVFIPLYGGKKLEDRFLADSTDQKSKTYDANLEILKEIAPKAKAILVGNAGPETTMKHLWIKNSHEDQKMVSEHMCKFAEEIGGIIKDAGGRPAFGTIDWDLAIDCYFGDSIFKDLINDMDALQICFCGYHLFGLVDHFGGNRLVPHETDGSYWPICPKKESEPRPILTDYIKDCNEIWSGVAMANGIIEGNDIGLLEHGFDAGVMGYSV